MACSLELISSAPRLHLHTHFPSWFAARALQSLAGFQLGTKARLDDRQFLS